jgi:hypothetical protein
MQQLQKEPTYDSFSPCRGRPENIAELAVSSLICCACPPLLFDSVSESDMTSEDEEDDMVGLNMVLYNCTGSKPPIFLLNKCTSYVEQKKKTRGKIKNKVEACYVIGIGPFCLFHLQV